MKPQALTILILGGVHGCTRSRSLTRCLIFLQTSRMNFPNATLCRATAPFPHSASAESEIGPVTVTAWDGADASADIGCERVSTDRSSSQTYGSSCNPSSTFAAAPLARPAQFVASSDRRRLVLRVGFWVWTRVPFYRQHAS